MDNLAQVILPLAVAIMVAFQRLHVPTSLGYRLVGLILGPHTAGPTVSVAGFKGLAEAQGDVLVVAATRPAEVRLP